MFIKIKSFSIVFKSNFRVGVNVEPSFNYSIWPSVKSDKPITFATCYCIATRFTDVMFLVDSNRTCFLNFYCFTLWFYPVIFFRLEFLLQVQFSKIGPFYFAFNFRIFSLVYLNLLLYTSPLFFFSLMVSLITFFY